MCRTGLWFGSWMSPLRRVWYEVRGGTRALVGGHVDCELAFLGGTRSSAGCLMPTLLLTRGSCGGDSSATRHLGRGIRPNLTGIERACEAELP